MPESFMQGAGLLLLDKPAGITSHDALVVAKKKLNLNRIGHTGTLDPMATGLLLCVVGNATRLARFLDGERKTYSGKIKLGLTTNTDDVTGQELGSSSIIPPFSQILEAISHFIGTTSQIPPVVSAIRIGGKRSHALARAGEQVELSPRKVTVHEFLVDQCGSDVVSFKISCSRGTYIRAIARDLGKLLGCGGCLKSLRRDEIGQYAVSSATQLDTLNDDDIIPLAQAFKAWPVAILPDEIARMLCAGDQTCIHEVTGDINEISSGREYVLYSAKSLAMHFLGILEKAENGWKIAINFGEDHLCHH